METEQLAQWINGLAGDYVENWVGEQIAAEWIQDKRRIAELESRLRWIPVEEREVETPCLVCDKLGIVLQLVRGSEDYLDLSPVTHWMPLPDPPQQEEK